MGKYIVQVEVSKIYKKTYEMTVYADSEDEASDKAEERASGWRGEASDIEVETLDVWED